MQIFLWVIQLLSMIAPAVAKVLVAINESKEGGIKEYDRLVAVALEQVKLVAAMPPPSTLPGGPETDWQRNIRLFQTAVYKTIDAAEKARITFKDHQITQAVSDAYTAWKMASKQHSDVKPELPSAGR